MGYGHSTSSPNTARLKKEYNAHFIRDSFKKNAFRHQSPVTSSRYYVDMIFNLRNGHNGVISDTAFCKEDTRLELMEVVEFHAPGTEIVWFCFANDPAQCRKNVISSQREVQSRLKHIDDYKDKYTYPPGVTPIPVGDGSIPATPPEDVEGLDL